MTSDGRRFLRAQVLRKLERFRGDDGNFNISDPLRRRVVTPRELEIAGFRASDIREASRVAALQERQREQRFRDIEDIESDTTPLAGVAELGVEQTFTPDFDRQVNVRRGQRQAILAQQRRDELQRQVATEELIRRNLVRRDGGVDLVGAVRGGVSTELLQQAGFSDEQIITARIAAGDIQGITAPDTSQFASPRPVAETFPAILSPDRGEVGSTTEPIPVPPPSGTIIDAGDQEGPIAEPQPVDVPRGSVIVASETDTPRLLPLDEFGNVRPTGGQVFVPGAPALAPGIPLGRPTGAAGTAAVITAAVAAESIRRNPEVVRELDEQTLRVLESMGLIRPGLREESPPGFAQVGSPGDPAITSPDIDASPPGFDTRGVEFPDIPQTPPEILRVLNSSATVVADANSLEGDLRRDPTLTPGQKAAVAAIARDIAEDIRIAVPLDVLLDDALIAAPPERRSHYAQRLEELRAKQAEFANARSALVESGGFDPDQIQDIGAITTSVQQVSDDVFGAPEPFQQPAITTQPLQPQTVVETQAPDVGDLGLQELFDATQGSESVGSTPGETAQTGTGTGTGTGTATTTTPTTTTTTEIEAEQEQQQTPSITQDAQQTTATQTGVGAPTRAATPSIPTSITRAQTTRTPSGRVPVNPVRVPLPNSDFEFTQGDQQPRTTRGGISTGATDLTADFVSGTHRHHRDLPEIPEISSRESFTSLEIGTQPTRNVTVPQGLFDIIMTPRGPIYVPRKDKRRGRRRGKLA